MASRPFGKVHLVVDRPVNSPLKVSKGGAGLDWQYILPNTEQRNVWIWVEQGL